MILDSVALTQQLIRCPSVTPVDAGVIDLLIKILEPLGFTCYKLPFGEVTNLYARLGTEQPNFCFAGHTDVVPVQNPEQWIADPFAAKIIENTLYGRGAVDMKGAIGCFIAAVSEILNQQKRFKGSISLLITGDEEGVAIDGTQKVLKWMEQNNQIIDQCLVGEPTNVEKIGDTVKIGRRGSINFTLTVVGIGGHVAYPHLAENPIPSLVKILQELCSTNLDEGNEFFPPSNLEVTSFIVDNNATNVIPSEATAKFNIRFNNIYSCEKLKQWVETVCNKVTTKFVLSYTSSADPFLTEKNLFSDIVQASITEITGISPELSTTGGTSDARFIKNYCPVLEFGLINKTAHKINESITVSELHTLTKIYKMILAKYFDKE
jgi:succinyl-diaminopimelate desuccinylase